MTRDDVLRIAKGAAEGIEPNQLLSWIEAFAEMAFDEGVLFEREECAKTCAAISDELANKAYANRSTSTVSLLGTRPSDLMMCASEISKCVSAIRARGMK